VTMKTVRNTAEVFAEVFGGGGAVEMGLVATYGLRTT